MIWLTTAFSLLVGAAGWFYLFYSGAAQKLVTIEDENQNRHRRIFRRIGGGAMLLLAAGLYVGLNMDADLHGQSFVLLWIGVMALLLIIVALALVDLRLTWKIRRRNKP
jgi:cytochrome bd-type quinol oxidase subunit 2